MAYNLNVAAAAVNSIWADRDANIEQLRKTVGNLPDSTDILILPELFSTGFISDEDTMFEMAEPISGKTMTAIRQLAAEHNTAIAGSFLCLVAGNITNRAFFIEPSGEESYYDKRHLFCGSPEARSFHKGLKMPESIRFRGWNISLAICYDIRFPVWCRNNDSNRYDLLIVPANWPESRAYAWEHLLIARAIENQAYVIGANRSGKDDYGTYSNLSFIFDPLGKPIAEQTAPDIITATLSKDTLSNIRTRMPVFNDADTFSILP